MTLVRAAAPAILGDPMSIAVALAEAFDVTLPAELVAFLDAEAKAHPDRAPRLLQLGDGGFVHGTFECDFLAEELADLEALCDQQCIDEGDTLAEEWKETFGGLVPLAVLDDHERGEEDMPVKAFLAIDTEQPGAPVFLWDYDGWHCYLIAPSFADFLAGKPAPAGTSREDVQSSIADRNKLGGPYTSFAWK